MAEKDVEPNTFLLALSSLGLLPSPLKKPPPLSVPVPNPVEDPNGVDSGFGVLVVEKGEAFAAELWPNTDPPLPLLLPEFMVDCPNNDDPEDTAGVPPNIPPPWDVELPKTEPLWPVPPNTDPVADGIANNDPEEL